MSAVAVQAGRVTQARVALSEWTKLRSVRATRWSLFAAFLFPIGLGALACLSLFDPEEQLGLDLIRSFAAPQRERAIIHPSLHPDEISPSLQNLFDGRMQAGAFHDNLVAPHQGVSGTDMTDAQRRALLALMDTYVGWTGDGHAGVGREEVAAHVDETWLSW